MSRADTNIVKNPVYPANTPLLMQGNEENSISMDLLFKVALGGFEGISDENKQRKTAAFNEVLEKAIFDPEIRSIISKMVCFEELGENRLTIDEVIEEVQKVLSGMECTI